MLIVYHLLIRKRPANVRLLLEYKLSYKYCCDKAVSRSEMYRSDESLLFVEIAVKRLN